MPLITEKNLENICCECGKKNDSELKSEWDETSFKAHYKSASCSECGYKISFKVQDGSGD